MPPAAPNPPHLSIEDEVLGTIQRQPIGAPGSPGAHTLADLELPTPYLRRIADRTIRHSYENNFRIIVRTAGSHSVPPPPTNTTTKRRPDHTTPASTIRIIDRDGDPSAIWRHLPEARPPARGFRAPILSLAADPDPFAPSGSATPELRRAADIIATRLAIDGLLPTLALALEALGSTNAQADPTAALSALRAAGFPTDLLSFFAPDSNATPAALIQHIAARLAAGAPAASLNSELSAIPFTFTPSAPNFRIATESGDHALGLLRLQMTSASYWGGVNAGSGLDIARQLAAKAPDLDLLISIERRFLDGFTAEARTWPLARDHRITLIPEPLTVAQWAQDNGKAGTISGSHPADGSGGGGGGGGATNSTQRPATLAPRFASRGEDGSIFIPGESSLMDGLAAAGHTVIHSPLLFQGGDLIALRHPHTNERILLIGEGQIHRNTALGLSESQVLAAFAAEFGVDRCIILPAVSLHIDYEVSVRAVDNRLIALVNDTHAAIRIILSIALPILERQRILDAPAARAARLHLDAGRDAEFLSLVGPRLYARSVGPGQFPESLADAFAAGPSDSGVGNLQRILLALDLLAARIFRGDEPTLDPHLAAYIRAIRRRDADRAQLWQILESIGCQIAPIPSLAEAERGLCAVNGIHDRSRYFIPAYGGLFAPLDQAAQAAARKALGPAVHLVPILCGESQRRVGALHCAVAAYPRA